MQVSQKPARALLIVVLTAGVALLAWRGPVRALREGNFDFKLIYSASRAWLVGSDPYELGAVRRAWVGAGGREDDTALVRPESSLVYAPPTFVLLAPIAALPWPAAGVAWVALNIVLMAGVIWGVAELAGLRGRARWAFWTAAIFFAPFTTSFGVGQLSILAMALIVGGQLLRARREGEPGGASGSFWGGALLGAAAVLKPQLGLLFVVYEAGRLRIRSLLGALACAALLLIMGTVRLQAAGIGWFSQWREHVRAFAREDGDPSLANPVRHHLLNLANPVHTVVDSLAVGRAITIGILGGLSLAYLLVDLRRGRQRGEGRAELISLSMVSVVTLLITYHRFYDAVLLLFPLALGIAGVSAAGRGRPRAEYALVLFMLLPFVVPGAVVLRLAEQRGWIPGALTGSWLWQGVILPHATWSLLLLGAWLVWLRSRTDATADQSIP